MNSPALRAALYAVALLLAAPFSAHADTLASYTFTSGAVTSDDTDLNSVAGSFTKAASPSAVSGASFTNGFAAISASALKATTLDEVVTKDEYYSFTLTSGSSINLTSLSIGTAFYGSAAAGTYNATYFIRSSVDSFASTIGSSVNSTNYQLTNTPVFATQTFDLSDPAFQSVSGSITFRIYIYDNNLTSATRLVALDDVVLTGTTSAVPEPSTYALLTGAASLALVLVHRRRS